MQPSIYHIFVSSVFFFPANENKQASCDRKCPCFLIKQSKLTVLTQPAVNGFCHLITCSPEGENTDNEERSSWVTNRFQIEMRLEWFSTRHEHWGRISPERRCWHLSGRPGVSTGSFPHPPVLS